LNANIRLFFISQQVMKFAELTQEVQVARPIGVYFDGVGLTPGRRKMHQQFKEALNTARTGKVIVQRLITGYLLLIVFRF